MPSSSEPSSQAGRAQEEKNDKSAQSRLASGLCHNLATPEVEERKGEFLIFKNVLKTDINTKDVFHVWLKAAGGLLALFTVQGKSHFLISCFQRFGLSCILMWS